MSFDIKCNHPLWIKELYIDKDYIYFNNDVKLKTTVEGNLVITTLSGVEKIIGTGGTIGADGAQGIQGDTGADGAAGAAGAAGAQGLKGATGDAGAQGLKGATGDAGAAGAQGLKGDAGATGDTGAAGADGAQGIQGIQGIQGNSGIGTVIYGNVYPYPVSSYNNSLNASSRTYFVTFAMPSNFKLTKICTNHPILGSDNSKVSIYRGTLSTGVLQGQSTSTNVTNSYFIRPVTVIAGQSLNFVTGEQVVVCYMTSGSSGTSISYQNTGPLDINLAFSVSNSTIASTFPTLISSIITSNRGTTSARICMDLQ
jgi:hypothetical protein